MISVEFNAANKSVNETTPTHVPYNIISVLAVVVFTFSEGYAATISYYVFFHIFNLFVFKFVFQIRPASVVGEIRRLVFLAVVHLNIVHRCDGLSRLGAHLPTHADVVKRVLAVLAGVQIVRV